MNKYIENPEEYKRIIRIIEAGLTAQETSFILRGLLPWQFARSMGITTQGKGKATVLNSIHNLIKKGKYPKEPTLKPIEQRTPVIEESEKPVIDGPVCDGCGGVSTFADVLRWGVALEGKAITYRVDYKSIPDHLKKVVTPEFVASAFGLWASVSGIKFKEVKKSANIVIQFSRIDGPGRILGSTFQPNNGLEMDIADLSGDITIDDGERWEDKTVSDSFWKLFIVLTHEIGHAIGLKHLDNWRSYMSATPLNAGNRRLHQDDIKAVQVLYPLNIKGIT